MQLLAHPAIVERAAAKRRRNVIRHIIRPISDGDVISNHGAHISNSRGNLAPQRGKRPAAAAAAAAVERELTKFGDTSARGRWIADATRQKEEIQTDRQTNKQTDVQQAFSHVFDVEL